MAAAVKSVDQPPREPTVKIIESSDRYKKQRPPPLDVSYAETSIGPKTPTSYTPRDREKKIGHRRVDDTGQVTYKKKPTSELMAAVQLGIGLSVGSSSSRVQRDVLLQDFAVVESVLFPSEGSNLTPAHHYSDFRFKTYAPVAFRYFRELFGIQPDDFLLSLCNDPLRELSNPGASGSIFYISNDDEFIIKTVQHKEAEFLQKLLPGYYMNLNQNPRTLLPKFYGLYCYQCGGKNIRFVVMNNLLPTAIRMHEKYDLKGSTYKRKASKRERAKNSPTRKDLDFLELNPEGIMLEADTHAALMKTMERDCRVLQSFKIMDYSLLGGVYNIDLAQKEKEQERRATSTMDSQNLDESITNTTHTNTTTPGVTRQLSRGRSVKQRLAAYSTAMESIQAESEPVELENEDVPPGGIPARNAKGERLLLYIGIIDILQSYRFKKKLEHAMKAMVHDGDTISVHRPGFYAQRFLGFFSNNVFKKIPSLDHSVRVPHMRFRKLVHLALRHSPSKKKGVSGRTRSTAGDDGRMLDKSMDKSRNTGNEETAGATGGRPDLLPASATPPRYLTEGSEERQVVTRSEVRISRTDSRSIDGHRPQISVTKSGSHPSGFGEAEVTYVPTVLGSPSHSISESTPTHTDYTEGTPSFTASSPSCSSDVLDQTSQATGKDSGISGEVMVEQIELEMVKPSSQGDIVITKHTPDTVISEHTTTTAATTITSTSSTHTESTNTASFTYMEAVKDEMTHL